MLDHVDWPTVLQTGGVGATLAFVLVRLEKALLHNTRAIDRLTLRIAVLLDRNTRVSEKIVTALEKGPPLLAPPQRKGSSDEPD